MDLACPLRKVSIEEAAPSPTGVADVAKTEKKGGRDASEWCMNVCFIL